MTGNRTFFLVALALISIIGLSRLAVAQGTELRVGPWLVGAGGRSQGSDLQVQGSAGQGNAGVVEGGEFRLKGGMWPSLETAGAVKLHLPVIIQQALPTVPTPATWKRIGAGGLMAAALGIQGEQLFVADRRTFATNGGLYRRSIASCATNLTTTLTRIENIQAPGFSVVFQGLRGVLAAFEGKIYYTVDGGNRWEQTASVVSNPRTVAVATNNIFYAGTEANGIYRSNDGGITWVHLDDVAAPNNLNTIRLDTLDANKLWIGTQAAGVQILTISTGRLIPSNNGLTATASREVYDFDFDSAGTIYVATNDGIFKGDGAGAWQAFGLQGVVQARSLMVVGDQLYAGAQSDENGTRLAGVWRRPLANGDWQQVVAAGWNPNYTVRDLLFDPTYCQGILAATNDGVWLYQ